MSIQTAIEPDEARRYAEKEVRYGLGTFCRLKDGEYDEKEGAYSFPIVIRSPRIIEDSQEEVIDVRFYEELELGTVEVDGSTGDVSRPALPTVRSKIKEQQEEIEIAVQKALVSAAGDKLSHLPFPENQYSPLEDILSVLLLEGQIKWETIRKMDEGRGNNSYEKYVDNLVQTGLASHDDDLITDGNILIEFNDKADSFQEAVNAAVGRYFEHNIGEFAMIKRTLGPYLAISGHYYRRSLEIEEMPRIQEDDLRRAIHREYSGREKSEKLMKFSRYLVQLEDVGIIESFHDGGDRYWVGDDKIRSKLVDRSEFLAPMQSLMSHTPA